jgi:hypothetical protein
MKNRVTRAMKPISYFVAGLLMAGTLVKPSRADIISEPARVVGQAGAISISVSCNGVGFYKEGPDGTLTCTIFNPFQNVLTVPKDGSGNSAVTLSIVNNGSKDSGDVALNPKLAAVPACFGNIPAHDVKANKDGSCAFDVSFSTDEAPAPKTETENIDSGSWLLNVGVVATSPKMSPSSGSTQYSITVLDAPEPSSLLMIAVGVLLLVMTRVLARVRPAYFSRTTSTLPNFSSAGPICLASPTTTIAD